ncbi:hypothetical protein RhiirA5_493395 [Rhizophagus irregularis]|uniref:Uncharacterized protein n=1 Tax=Rhizophagus irregularis TaxID=588596 RepID=A0A2N0QD34_9GLOM|nr:hypothetical protein RhiirA5_493395 [Rhizophagus irregularis]
MGLDFGTYFYLKNYTILIGWMNTTGQMRSLIEHNHVISGTPLEHGIEALEHIFGISCQVIADFNFYEFYKIQKYGIYVFDIDGTSLPHEIIECLRTWPSDDDIKEAIRVGYNEAIALANYFEINNYNSVSIQQLVARVEFSSDGTNIPEIIDENQNQNLTNESDNNTEFADENETTNPLSMNFPDLQYILNQKSVPQNQFENFDQLFTLEGFLCPKILINIRKNHDAFSQHSKKTNHEFTNNSIQENHVNRRKDRWEGCKRLATIPIASGTNIHNIIDANVSNLHPLILNGYLIIYSDKKLCIAQIISMYEKRGERHAWMNKDC